MKRNLILACAAASLLGCGPADGVISFAFGLALPGAVSFPTEAELGAPIDGTRFAQAKGRCSGDPGTHRISVSVEGLPPLGVAPEKAYYRFSLSVGETVIGPQASFDRLLRFLSPVGTAWASGTHEVPVGALEPDALGRANLEVRLDDVAIDHATGGKVEIVVPISADAAKSFKILVGEVGNLENESSGGGAPAAGGHSH